jgi:predicted Fe-Mo cluster-binding NifX family protein
MKAALTVWDGRISPVFDVSREALVLTIQDGAEVERRVEDIGAPDAARKVQRLLELGVQDLVCGAISEPLQHELKARGLRVICFVAGEVTEVVRALLAGELPTPALLMPGCRGPRNRFRRGRGRGGQGRRGRGCARDGQ